MGSMSMPNAAPLPRLGEVFFDVRSPSRSLRISWYADTGVAVLSIWQGGTCTGSFRLPMGDLPRMIAALQRGPDGPAGGGNYTAPAAPDHAPPGAGDYPPEGNPDPRAGAAAGYDPYAAGPGSLHYLNGSAAGPYPDETGAIYPDGLTPGHYPDSAAPAHYPDSPAPAHYPDSPVPAHRPDEAAAVYPDNSAWPGGRGAPVPSRYPDEADPPLYLPAPAGQDFPADPPGDPYPPGSYSADSYPPGSYPSGSYPSGSYPSGPYSPGPYPDSPGPYPAGPYPAGTESPDHSAGPSRIDRPQPPVPGSPYGPAQPGLAAPERAPGPGSMPVAPTGEGRESLPESVPPGAPRHGHRRHKQPSRPLRPFD
jgi:hypothetical protein